MKRILLIMLAIMLYLSVLSGCAKNDDLFHADKIEITKYSTTSDRDEIYSITVESAEQVKYMCDNLNSLSMRKMRYNKPTVKEYSLVFYSAGKETESISITAHGWIGYNGDFYNIVDGELDIDYIDAFIESNNDDGKSADVSNAIGMRIWDRHHPDDSERYPFFSVTLPALDNAKVEYKVDDCKIYLDGEPLLGGLGHGCDSFYLSDLTGDGYPELCFAMNFGNGIVDERIEIIDYTAKTKIFTLSDRMAHDYYLFLREGVLCVKETEYAKGDPLRTGVLTYNGWEITVHWDSEVNANVDRDEAAPGEPVH